MGMACNGGWIDNALYYILTTGYIDSYDSYPYVSGQTRKAGTCVADPSNSCGSISDCGATTKNSESELTSALAQVGPVGIAIDAGYILMGRNMNNQCGVAATPAYAI